MRGLDGTDFADNSTAKFYEGLNLPFLNWLASLRNDQERADKTAEWKRILKTIAIIKAEEILKMLLQEILLAKKIMIRKMNKVE